MSHPPPVLEFQSVRFAYDAAPVLHAVNLCIHERDFACVVGPNGGGKSTLLKLALGLLVPQQGEVRVLGQSPLRARTRVGYMPQHAQLDPHFPATVQDVVLMGRLGGWRPIGRFAPADRALVAQCLREVGLSGLGGRAFAGLSGGQRQRTLIARALATQPQLLMLDEPTANLDVAGQDELYELLARLNERMTLLVVSHDLRFVHRYVRSVVCVNRHVHLHPTASVDRDLIGELFGRNVRLVRHDREEPHVHAPPAAPPQARE